MLYRFPSDVSFSGATFCPNFAAAQVLPIQPKLAPESKMKSPLLIFFPEVAWVKVPWKKVAWKVFVNLKCEEPSCPRGKCLSMFVNLNDVIVIGPPCPPNPPCWIPTTLSDPNHPVQSIITLFDWFFCSGAIRGVSQKISTFHRQQRPILKSFRGHKAVNFSEQPSYEVIYFIKNCSV